MNSIDDIPIQPDLKTKRSIGQIMSVCISVIALVVSIFAFHDSHENRKLQNELARPKLQVSGVHVLTTKDEPEMYKIAVPVENIGGLTATVFDISPMPEKRDRRLGLTLPVECLAEPKSIDFDKKDVEAANTRVLGVEVDFGNNCHIDQKQPMRLTIKYSDPTGHSYVQFFNVPSEGPAVLK